LAYDQIRSETALGSQHAILATRAASEAIKGCIDRFRTGRNASKPTFSAPTVRYDARSMTLFEDGTVSLATTGSRVRCPLKLPDAEDGYQFQYLNDPTWEPAGSTLTVRDGSIHLHIGVRRPKQDGPVDVTHPAAEGGAVLGVDMGVNRIAVTSTARFFHGGELQHRIREHERVRAELNATGTRSARRTLRSMSGRQRRHITEVVHQVANGIIQEAVEHDCAVIAIEDLSNIREEVKNNSWFHRWAFRQLRDILSYKVQKEGIKLATVEPRNTSIGCSECGHVADANRTGSRFRRRRCGLTADADYNAAKNVAFRYVRRGPQSPRGTGASHCTLKSGTVTPSGDYTHLDA
jgi:putative transposase